MHAAGWAGYQKGMARTARTPTGQVPLDTIAAIIHSFCLCRRPTSARQLAHAVEVPRDHRPVRDDVDIAAGGDDDLDDPAVVAARTDLRPPTPVISHPAPAALASRGGGSARLLGGSFDR